MQTMTMLSTHNLEISRQYSTPSSQKLIKRFKYFIEKSNWDEKILTGEKWANRVCFGIITLSALFFSSIVVSIILQ